MTTLDTSAYVDSVVKQTKILAEWVHGKDPSTPVPTCPNWDLGELVSHVGETQRMVATLVEQRLTDPSVVFGNPDKGPGDPARWSGWLTETAAAAAGAFGSVTDATSVWDPSGGNQGVVFWSRRLFGEIVVHRADAAGALGRRYEVAPEDAVAAIDDWLATMTSAGYTTARPEFLDAIRDTGAALHFQATDTVGGWLVRRTADTITLERTQNADADSSVRGQAVELLLVLTRRGSLDAARGLELHGDRKMLDIWIEHMDWIAD